MTTATIMIGAAPGNPVVPAVIQEAGATIDQRFTLTVRGTGWVMGTVDIWGSPDGFNYQNMAEMTAQGVAPVSTTHRVASPFSFWTATPRFCSPGAVVDLTMLY